ncbi:ATP-binding protein [Methylobacterium aquaticum]|uniref:DNA double-strand break repair rad50 ATPase n=1 Tax=Methylobacterium aquaticum TaxID=270351 RepID=A0A0C6G2F6_9HYPH|nr:AAA family ATPase [Methylobacterium aquaticum]BAQ50265.1 DNA double-strand break repair rad50 ATPase [Methylobacterium aquaticum]
MIEQLTFTVRFPPTDHYPLGRAFDRTLDFSAGMTAITGANEAGKTLVLEMIEFLLFGSAALRGKAEDYKAMKASGIVLIRGQRYRIERTTRNAALQLEGETLAVGTKPVNARILQILGYGLDVFRVANVANQGDAERLSKMKPTERKAMVDKLIGADQLEAVANWCGDQALGVTREIAGLETGLAEPREPAEPADYGPANELQDLVRELRAARDRAVELRAFLANPPTVPVLGEAPTSLTLEALDRADQVLGLRTYDFDLEVVTAQHDAYDLWKERQAFVHRAFPQPTLTQEQVDAERRRQGLNDDLKRLRKSPVLTCPCGKPFTTADAEIARIETELAEIPVPEGLFDLDIEARALRTWSKPEVQAEWQRLAAVPQTDAPEHSPSEAKGAVHVNEVREALAALGLAGCSRAEIRTLAAGVRAHQATAAAVASAQARRDEWDQRAAVARTQLEELEDFEQLPALEARLGQAQVYEAQLEAYTAARAEWDAKQARLAELRDEQTSWRNGKAAMNEVRQDTKTYLAPALSRVASHMLAEMTGGQRGRIVVDEDFEIQVDGQPLNTLSGSGKVCANLAVRLGLGRILTNGVFPVFMGDEMDASMDADRAGHLHDALCALEGKLRQILIITHKTPACPRVIKLEH